MQFPAIYLLHGRGGSPNGSVMQLENELRVCEPEQNYFRPLMPHTDPKGPTWASVLHLRNISVPNGSLIIGVSLGGLVAAKLQELERSDLHVICISSPTHAEDTELRMKMERRVALYSSADEVISGRTERWPELASEAYDLPWLDHDTDKHKKALAQILCGYWHGLNISVGSEHGRRTPKTSSLRHPLFSLLVGFFLIADPHQFQRLDAGHFKITAALQTRYEFTFFEFLFFDINLALALRAHDHELPPLRIVEIRARHLAFITYLGSCLRAEKRGEGELNFAEKIARCPAQRANS